MTQYQTEAILLAVRNWGEADKMVTLFSREHGKVNAMAYGARRPRSHLAGGMQAFMHVNVSLTPGKGMDYIKQYEMINAFRPLREELVAMAYGSLILELTSELCPERQPEPLVFDLLQHILMLFLIRNPRVVALAGAWQMLAATGFSPELKKCTICGQALAFPAFFSTSAGGGVCQSCKVPESMVLNEAAAIFLEKLLSLDLVNPGHFTVSGAALIETERLLMRYLAYHIDKPLKSLTFIKGCI